MRPQYHIRSGPEGWIAWDVKRLIALADGVPVMEVECDPLVDADPLYWFQGFNGPPSVRTVADHARLMDAADLSYPILLCAEGRVMDGMHRVAKALVEGRNSILAKQFSATPEPDFVGVHPDELPY